MQDTEIQYAKILIVDDNSDDSVLLERLLKRAGYQNIRAINDSRLVTKLHEKERFDLILLDYNMPFLGGLAVVDLLKSIEQDSYVPVLMVTAHHDRETRLRVLAAGCKDIICKPYDRTEIINRVKNMVEVRLLHTQVKEQNRALLERENGLRTIVENVAEGIIATDERGNIKTFNVAAENMYGYKTNEIVGKNINFLISHEDESKSGAGLAEFLAAYAQFPSAGKGRECVGLRKNGETFPLNIVVTEALQHDQRVFVAICRDITEEKRAEEVLRAARDVLEERVRERTAKLIQINDKLVKEINIREHAEKELASARDRALEASNMKSEFLANVSHEIRTPLNGMLGMLSILSESGLKTEQEDYVRTAYRSGEILLNLINELLDFSKVEAGKIDIEYVNYDLHEMVDDVLQLFDEQIATKGLKLVKNITESIPQKVLGDPWRIRQVIINLVGNAIKFTEKGLVTLAIKLERVGGAHFVLRFEVSDTGLGISKSDQMRIFESFTQADGSTTRRFGGTGLGLSISKKLIALMGGEIGVESKPGIGSTFWFTLPQGRLEEGTVKIRDERIGDFNNVAESGDDLSGFIDENSFGPKKLRVLVVEDNTVNQKVAIKMLEKLSCAADVATDGAMALEAIKNKVYDLVLMDCLMPVMDGFESTKMIRAYERDQDVARPVPIIAMTANVRKQDQDKCYAAGMDAFLSKPISLDAVRSIISEWVLRVGS